MLETKRDQITTDVDDQDIVTREEGLTRMMASIMKRKNMKRRSMSSRKMSTVKSKPKHNFSSL